MNKTVTSRAELLAAAKHIVYQEGLDQLNIRRLAKECGIALGSVYNYFPSKSDLIFGVIEDFWTHMFHDDLYVMSQPMSFPEFFAEVYQKLSISLNEFEASLLKQLSLLSSADKAKGRDIEGKYWQHMQEGFVHCLNQDDQIDASIWHAPFTKERFSQFVFMNMMTMLRSGITDCSFFQEVLKRLLYK